MPASIEHKRYLIGIIQNVNWDGDIRIRTEPWWEAPIGTSDAGMPVYAVPDGNMEPAAAVVLRPETSIPQALAFFEAHLDSLCGEFLPGGLAMIDLDSCAVLRTNWDLGETEEWLRILDALTAGRPLSHTFSATDLAAEMCRVGDTINLQLLDWEAVPNRLETSRWQEPIHRFTDANLFVQQVESCLSWLRKLQACIAKRRSPHRHRLLQLVSMEARSMRG